MSEQPIPFTIASFYKFVSENKLMAAKCSECGTVLLPPKPMCTNCLSTNLKWIELDGAGKLLSYTIIHVAPEQFQSMAPYTVGIVELKKGLRLPGMIRNVNPEEIKIGMNLKIDFDSSTSSQWPAWTRYFFKPL
ncbi:Zn-ribbon domain-containing OB-fold protein [Candidatus Bathyarchaeota archaeon]|nr:Zn-ribbon domain-containing OB-fold protein [Candidatus Bathyarchaeota archaeon]